VALDDLRGGVPVALRRRRARRTAPRGSPPGRTSIPPRGAFLGALFGYSAAYYALWLTADVLIVLAGLDLGWAIRMVPNQLYYAFWTPFVYARFFSGAPANATR
jgi:hypothetical protein